MIIGTVPYKVAEINESDSAPEVDVVPVSKPEVDVVPVSKKEKSSFLYIGEGETQTAKCLLTFQNRYLSRSFDEATGLLCKLYKENTTPDFIIVDKPLVEKEFANFVLWLHSNKWSFILPVLYNETVLNEDELSRLRELSLADDIVDVQEFCNQLQQKAELIRNSKTKSESKEKNLIEETEGQMLTRTPFWKRVFDIVISLSAILLLSPLLLVIAIVVKATSRGPVIYKSKRAGRGFRVFTFFKFRTMYPNADKFLDEYVNLNVYEEGKNGGSFVKLKHDPRVTKFGSFLRKTSLDELPQLFNVLKGDMSIVGNRPLPLYEAATLTTNDYSARFIAPAGMTGLWQVTKRGMEDMSAQERIELDINYAKEQSFALDFSILVRTPRALFQKSED